MLAISLHPKPDEILARHRYFEGIDSERGIAWRVADSLALRRFLLIGLDERPPDHSTISRTRLSPRMRRGNDASRNRGPPA